MQKLIPLRQINEDLKSEIQTLQIGMDEKEFKLKAMEEDLRMAERQLERLENQNKIFESDSLSEDSSDGEESKGTVKVISGGNSFDNSRDQSGTNHSRTSIGGNDTTGNSISKINTTAKSTDITHESSNMRALQESLENFQSS